MFFEKYGAENTHVIALDQLIKHGQQIVTKSNIC